MMRISCMMAMMSAPNAREPEWKLNTRRGEGEGGGGRREGEGVKEKGRGRKEGGRE